MTPRTVVTTEAAPAAIGPYSQAIVSGDLLWCSGALPLDPVSGGMVTGSLAAETSQCLANLAAVCAAAGTSLDSAVRLTVYTTQLSGFDEINEAYAKALGSAPPARVTIGVAELPRGARVEIDAVVALT